jgi:2-iminobutanoate/2-iminopropanoate deaminase
MVKPKLLSAVALVILSSPVTAGTGLEYFNAPRPALNAALPFSDAVRAGDTLYVSGTLGIDPKTGKAVEGTDAEAHAVLDAFKATLERAGYSLEDVVTVQVYCTDLALYDAFNGVYRGYFGQHFPARAFLGVKELVRGAHFEVQGIAVRTAAR